MWKVNGTNNGAVDTEYKITKVRGKRK